MADQADLLGDPREGRVMNTPGSRQAKIRFSNLLGRVARGEEITITRHGKTVARLVPVGTVGCEGLEVAVARRVAFRGGRRLKDLSAKALIEEGRR